MYHTYHQSYVAVPRGCSVRAFVFISCFFIRREVDGQRPEERIGRSKGSTRQQAPTKAIYIYVPCAAQGTSFKNVPVHVCLLQGEAHTKGVAVALEKQKIIGDVTI